MEDKNIFICFEFIVSFLLVFYFFKKNSRLIKFLQSITIFNSISKFFFQLNIKLFIFAKF
jgi:hypothetical protein